MKTYVGTKIIQAEPMDLATFTMQVRPVPDTVKVGPDGKGKPGYKVVYSGGYVSWSPKDVFEKAYREISEEEKKLI